MNQPNPYRQETAYDTVPQPGNPTYSEAWALVEAARRMTEPIEHGSLENIEDLAKVRIALRLNWRLWTIFQTELSLEEGSVPDNIRENMLSLCNFVDTHSVEMLNEPTVEGVLRLIELNRQIANGLLESLQTSMNSTETASNDVSEEKVPTTQAITSINTDV